MLTQHRLRRTPPVPREPARSWLRSATAWERNDWASAGYLGPVREPTSDTQPDERVLR